MGLQGRCEHFFVCVAGHWVGLVSLPVLKVLTI